MGNLKKDLEKFLDSNDKYYKEVCKKDSELSRKFQEASLAEDDIANKILKELKEVRNEKLDLCKARSYARYLINFCDR